jgi:Holliday junction DNA helicase RuvA
MIGRLRGLIVERGIDGTVVLDVGGIGYEVSVPLGALGRLPAPPELVTLHVHTHVREDAISLFGFPTTEDRAAFRTLMTVSSVGPKLALGILSHLDARSLAAAVVQKDGSGFKGIPGVGKKIADRLVLELRDKLGFVSAATIDAPSVVSSIPIPAGPLAQVVSVLVSMGFKPSEAERAVLAVEKDSMNKSVEVLLREALAAMG